MATKLKNKKSVSAKSSNTQQRKVTPAKAVTPQKQNSALRVKKQYVILIFALLLLAFFIVRYRSVFVAAVVNGQLISRIDVVKESERQNGKQVLNTLIRNKLIEQEAKKQKVSVPDQEVNAEIKKIEVTLSKQGKKLDQELASENLTRDDLKKLIRPTLLLGKLVGKDVKITDKEVTDYIEANKDSLPQDQTEEQLKQLVSKELKQQALRTKGETWLEGLQSKAKIQYFVQY